MSCFMKAEELEEFIVQTIHSFDIFDLLMVYELGVNCLTLCQKHNHVI